MTLVTVDTNILIWGVRQDCTPGQEPMRDRSMALLNEIREHHQIAITAICVAEYLALSSDEEANAELVFLASQFMILPFDAKAAKISAKLFRDRKQTPVTEVKGKVEIKADTQLVGCAAAHGVKVVYSHDAGVRYLAKMANMSGRDVPEVTPASGRKQKDLFEAEPGESA